MKVRVSLESGLGSRYVRAGSKASIAISALSLTLTLSLTLSRSLWP